MRTYRLERLKLKGRACYHVMSRITERRFYLGDYEKDKFCDMMCRAALFSGIHILTYCIMDNHFHILIEIPERRSLPLKEVKSKLPLIYRGSDLKRVLQEFEQWEQLDNEIMINKVKQQYEKRMFDLSEFMKTLKQRFSIWYNRNHGDRRGTLWEEDRFISVLVQSPRNRKGDMGMLAIMTMAAYIELNAVRAGIVEDPKDYLWCGYGAATAGIQSARSGLKTLMGCPDNNQMKWATASRTYRKHLFIQGGVRGGISLSAMYEVLQNDGALSRAQLLHCRTRYFSSGIVIGSKDYITRVVEEQRACFLNNSMKRIHHLRGGNWGGLCAAKNCG